MKSCRETKFPTVFFGGSKVVKTAKSFALEREPFARRFASAYLSCGFVYSLNPLKKCSNFAPRHCISLFSGLF